MIDDQTALILPLVHHFVQERVQSLVQAVTAKVTARDGDLWGNAGTLWRVVAEPRLHSPGHTYRNRRKLPVKLFRIVLLMPLGHSHSEWLVVRMCAFDPTIAWRQFNRRSMSNDQTLRGNLRSAATGHYEIGDRLVDW